PGQRTPNNSRDSRRRHETGNGGRTLTGGKPQAQIEDDSWKESCFGDAQKKPKRVKSRWGPNDRHCRGNESPGDHDPCDPHPGADAREDQVTWNFKEKVPDEEDARAESIHAVAESERRLHLELREANVDSIQIRCDLQHT